jgi:hypothetical protein
MGSEGVQLCHIEELLNKFPTSSFLLLKKSMLLVYMKQSHCIEFEGTKDFL